MSFAFGHSAAQTQTHTPILSAEFLCGTHGLSLQLDASLYAFLRQGLTVAPELMLALNLSCCPDPPPEC